MQLIISKKNINIKISCIKENYHSNLISVYQFGRKWFQNIVFRIY